jgi:hypothetical protein
MNQISGKESIIPGGRAMMLHGLRQRVGLFLKNLFPASNGEDIAALKREIQVLRNELRDRNCADPDGVSQSRETLGNCLQQAEAQDVRLLKQEIGILRNEMQENIAAIHRLEVLTLAERIDLLNVFGKTLPAAVPGRSRRSSKPKGFSFGIITNGNRPEKLDKLIESIVGQKLPSHTYEIMISGRVDHVAGRPDVRTYPLEQAADEGRLGAMRNVLARSARFNKFVCLDDDFLLHPSWAQAVLEVQDDFDIATGIILNPDLSRYCDWVNIIENYTFLRAYHETFAKCQYVTGGYGIYKDFIFQDHSWNEDLGFYQGEDVSFSRRLFDAGHQLKFIPKAVVMHDDERYRQKGYGVIRLKSAEELADVPDLALKMEKLCPRTLS